MDNYPKEPIPDDAYLFYRIHKSFIVDNEIIPGAFQSKIDGTSTDWDKYSTAKQSLALSKVPAHNGIVRFHVEVIRKEPCMDVEHAPQLYNCIFRTKFTSIPLESLPVAVRFYNIKDV